MIYYVFFSSIRLYKIRMSNHSDITLTASKRVHLDNTTSTDIGTTSLEINGGTYIKKDVWIGGNISITGNTNIYDTHATFKTEEVLIDNPLLLIGQNNTSDNLYSGIMNRYKNDPDDDEFKFTGLIRQPNNDTYVLVKGVDADSNNDTSIDENELGNIISNKDNNISNFSDIILNRTFSNNTNDTSAREDTGIYTNGSLCITKNVYIGDETNDDGTLKFSTNAKFEHSNNNFELYSDKDITIDINTENIAIDSSSNLSYDVDANRNQIIVGTLTETIVGTTNSNIIGHNNETYLSNLQEEVNNNNINHTNLYNKTIHSASTVIINNNLTETITQNKNATIETNMIETYNNKNTIINTLIESNKGNSNLTTKDNVVNNNGNKNIDYIGDYNTTVYNNSLETINGVQINNHIENVDKKIVMDYKNYHNNNINSNNNNDTIHYQETYTQVTSNLNETIQGNEDSYITQTNTLTVDDNVTKTLSGLHDVVVDGNVTKTIKGDHNFNIVGDDIELYNINRTRDSHKNVTDTYGSHVQFVNTNKESTINGNNVETITGNKVINYKYDKTVTLDKLVLNLDKNSVENLNNNVDITNGTIAQNYESSTTVTNNYNLIVTGNVTELLDKNRQTTCNNITSLYIGTSDIYSDNNNININNDSITDITIDLLETIHVNKNTTLLNSSTENLHSNKTKIVGSTFEKTVHGVVTETYNSTNDHTINLVDVQTYTNNSHTHIKNNKDKTMKNTFNKFVEGDSTELYVQTRNTTVDQNCEYHNTGKIDKYYNSDHHTTTVYHNVDKHYNNDNTLEHSNTIYVDNNTNIHNNLDSTINANLFETITNDYDTHITKDITKNIYSNNATNHMKNTTQTLQKNVDINVHKNLTKDCIDTTNSTICGADIYQCLNKDRTVDINLKETCTLQYTRELENTKTTTVSNHLKETYNNNSSKIIVGNDSNSINTDKDLYVHENESSTYNNISHKTTKLNTTQNIYKEKSNTYYDDVVNIHNKHKNNNIDLNNTLDVSSQYHITSDDDYILKSKGGIEIKTASDYYLGFLSNVGISKDAIVCNNPIIINTDILSPIYITSTGDTANQYPIDPISTLYIISLNSSIGSVFSDSDLYCRLKLNPGKFNGQTIKICLHPSFQTIFADEPIIKTIDDRTANNFATDVIVRIESFCDVDSGEFITADLILNKGGMCLNLVYIDTTQNIDKIDINNVSPYREESANNQIIGTGYWMLSSNSFNT